MPHPNSESIQFAYYPDGDRDPIARRSRMDLVREGGAWRLIGKSKPLSDEEIKKIQENVSGGRSKIQKIVSHGRREDGTADLLGIEKKKPKGKDSKSR